MLATPGAVKLFHEGVLALAQVERNGMRIDADYLTKTSADVRQKIYDLKEELRNDKLMTELKRKFKSKANPMSPDQIGWLAFDHLGYKAVGLTETGKYQADKNAFEFVEHSFVRKYQYIKKLEKLHSTYLEGTLKEVVGGYIHPNFNLNNIVSFRSSSDRPNVQNQPIRDPDLAQYVRRMFIPSKGRRLVEVDMSGAEVRISACYNKDPVLINYIKDPTTDMHRDTASQMFLLPIDWLIANKDWTKKTVRDWSKNRFVFPQFYGSVYFQCAPNLWKAVAQSDVQAKLPNGKTGTIRDHLASKGVTELGRCAGGSTPSKGTFEQLVYNAERDMWYSRFRVYQSWKVRYWKEYQSRGELMTYTGFRIGGHLARNDVLNYSVQGCLAGSSRVLTNVGLVPIRELVGENVRVWTGFRWADAVGLNRGKCRRAVIELQSGLVINCDTRHKLKNENNEWIKFADLQVGSWVALPKCLKAVSPSSDINWWFVFGFILGDGCLRNRIVNGNDNKIVSIVGGKIKRRLLLGIYDFLRGHGYKPRWRVTPAKGTRAEKYSVILQSKRFAQFAERYGFSFDWKSKTKRVPESVWRGTPQEQRDFMEGLWLSDGSRGRHQEKNLHMGNLPLLKDIQILIGGLGYDSIISQTKNGHLLRVHYRRPGAYGCRKYPVTALHKLVGRVQSKNYTSESEYVCDHRNLGHGKDVNQYIAERMIDRNGPADAEAYRYDKIKVITLMDTEEDTFTMSVDDPLHQFVADGVIHKNSAFHCLLWALIRLQKWLNKHRMKTKVICEIHDSILLDMVESEMKDVLAKLKEIITVDLPRFWDWIIVPLAVEAEASEVDGNWYEKKGIEI